MQSSLSQSFARNGLGLMRRGMSVAMSRAGIGAVTGVGTVAEIAAAIEAGGGGGGGPRPRPGGGGRHPLEGGGVRGWGVRSRGARGSGNAGGGGAGREKKRGEW